MKIILRIFITLIIYAMSQGPSILGAATGDEGNTQTLDSDLYYFYGLDDQVNVEVDVASLFMEDELVLGSTVSQITPDKWKQMGARRTHEALNNEMSVITHPFTMGSYITNIRGYTSGSSHCGIAYLIDGVPLNEHRLGGGMLEIPNWELGILNKIEMIKGPGSAIYGSDAFSGVISMKTFESDKDYYAVEGAGAYPAYGDGNIQISQGLYDNLIRIDAAAAGSSQGDIDQEYKYDDPTGWFQSGLPAGKGKGTREWQYDSQAGVLKIRIQPENKFNIKLGGYVNRFKGDEFPASRTGLTNLRDNDLSFNDAMFYMGNGNINYTFDNKISVEASGYFWLADTEISAMIGPEEDMFLANKREFSRSGASLTAKQPENSFNLQWLIAYSYGRYDLYDATYTLSTGIPVLNVKDKEEEFANYLREINSVYSQIKWGLLRERIYLLLGGRIDDYSDFGKQVTPRGGIIFLPTEKSSIKALYGRAFRAPSITERYGIIQLIKHNFDIKPETIDSYELIYIYKEKQWKTTVSTFYSYWKDGIVAESRPDLEPQFQGMYTNKGKNEAMGGEFNFYGSFDRTYAVELGFSYVTSVAIDAEDNTDTDATTDRKYESFPEYSVNAGLHYTFKPYQINFYLNNRIYLNMKEYPSEVISNPDRLPPYYRADLNIHKIFMDNLEIFIDIRNLLNRKNYLPSIVGAENGYEEQSTSVLVRAGFKF